MTMNPVHAIANSLKCGRKMGFHLLELRHPLTRAKYLQERDSPSLCHL
jgi:hypothetical protein